MVSVLLPAWLVGVLTFALMFAVLMFWCALLIPMMTLRLLLPFALPQAVLSYLIDGAARGWAGSNQALYRILHGPARYDLPAEEFDPSKSWLVICNHQSWADILILFDLLHGRLPFLRFFMKQELIWVPLVGPMCWALDMPFMKRHSREAIAADPSLREQDLRTTRAFCEKYRRRRMAAVNFLEGTRFTPAKRDAKGSPYRHLLRPKAAGLSFTLDAMGDQFGGIVDVTLAYRATGKSLLWSWLCGEQAEMAAHVDRLPIPPDLLHGDYDGDAVFRARFQEWVNGIWSRKDQRLDRADAEARAHARPRLT